VKYVERRKTKILKLSLCIFSVLVTAGCSNAAVSKTTTTSLVLVPREGVRTGKVLVPSTWNMQASDGNGSGSNSIWTNPANKNEWISLTTGVEVGAWYLGNNVASINPKQLLPDSAQIKRVDAKIFEYSYPGSDGDTPSPNRIDGMFKARLDANENPSDFITVEVSTPKEDSYITKKVIEYAEINN